MFVWTYWEGPRLPFIDVCIHSMAHVCKMAGLDFRLVTPANIYDYIDKNSLHPAALASGRGNVSANCARAALLAEHGGWWWDADTLALRDPSPLPEMYPDDSVLYMTWSNPPRRILNGYIYMRPGCEYARQWLDKINERLENDYQNSIQWLQLGEKILTPILDGQPGCREVARRLFLPIDIDKEVDRFFENIDFGQYLENDTICFGLNHSWMVHKYKNAMKKMPVRWKDSRQLIHQLLEHVRLKSLDSTMTAKPRLRKTAKAKIAVVTLATGDYMRGAEVLFRSLANHGLPDCVDRIVAGDCQQTPSWATRVIPADRYGSVATKRGQFEQTAKKFAALALDYDRIVMIDSDIFCVKNCGLLWSDNISRLPFYAVHDTATIKYYRRNIERLGLDKDRLFNAGTMVYNRNLLPNLHDDLLEKIHNGECFSYDGGDQGYLNDYFQKTGEEVGYLPAGYNFLLDPNMPQVPRYARYLFHFAGGGLKPWHADFKRDGEEFVPYLQQWREYNPRTV